MGLVRQINIPGLRIQRMFSWALPSGELGGLPGEFYQFANSIRSELSAVSVCKRVFEKLPLPLRSRAHLRDYGSHSTDATTPISTRPPGPGSPRTCRQPGRVGGHARPTCALSLTRSFTCCEPVASGACYPALFPRPGTVYHYFRAWKDAGVLAELQRALHEQARLSRGHRPKSKVFRL